MAVSSEPGEDYGKMRVLQLPSNTTIPGPQQVQNNFESDPAVSSQLSLLRRGGSEVEFGNLLSLPFNDGLLYVEPVYIRATTDGYPLLRKVLVGYGQNVALENTLDVALAKVFGTSPEATADQKLTTTATLDEPTPEPTPTPTPTEEPTGDPATDLAIAITQAQRAYEDGQIALAKGDFAAYGEAQERLKAALDAAATAEAQLNGGLLPGEQAAGRGGTRRRAAVGGHRGMTDTAAEPTPGSADYWDHRYETHRRHQRVVVPGHPRDQPRADRAGRRPARQRRRRGRRGEPPGRPAARGRAPRRHRRRPQPAGAHAAHQRIGEAPVTWVVTDIRDWQPDRTFDVWHDRAAYHFLTDPDDQQHYWHLVRESVPHGGHVVIATFAEDGPEMCSGPADHPLRPGRARGGDGGRVHRPRHPPRAARHPHRRDAVLPLAPRPARLTPRLSRNPGPIGDPGPWSPLPRRSVPVKWDGASASPG